MNCPLCGKELESKTTIDPNTGKVLWFLACPVIYRKILECKSYSHIFDVNHYQLWDNESAKAEVAYVPPYRVHNVLDENYCEVSDCSNKVHEGTAVLFKCPLIKFTSADTLRQRIKNLVIFS